MSKRTNGVVKVSCNPEGRPGYPAMVKAKCYDCSPEPGDCAVPGCPLYAVSPKNKTGKVDLSWLVMDGFHQGQRERVELVNQGKVIKTLNRKDYYPENNED